MYPLIPLSVIKELLDDAPIPSVLEGLIGFQLLEHHARHPRLTRPVMREFHQKRSAADGAV